MKTRQEISQWVEQNREHCPEWSNYGKDTNQDREEDIDKAKVKVLVAFASTGDTRAVSNTFTCLNLLIHAASDTWTDFFVDNSYLPELDTREAMIKEGIPFLFGNVSRMPWTEYDIILLSHAIMPECINMPILLHNSGIPLSMEGRDEANAPLILYGGAAATGGFSILGGKLPGGGKGLYDIANFGMGETTLPPLFKTILGYEKDIKTNRKDCIEYLYNSDRKDWILIPNKYEVEIDPKTNLHISEINYLDERTPKKVKYGRLPRAHLLRILQEDLRRRRWKRHKLRRPDLLGLYKRSL